MKFKGLFPKYFCSSQSGLAYSTKYVVAWQEVKEKKFRLHNGSCFINLFRKIKWADRPIFLPEKRPLSKDCFETHQKKFSHEISNCFSSTAKLSRNVIEKSQKCKLDPWKFPCNWHFFPIPIRTIYKCVLYWTSKKFIQDSFIFISSLKRFQYITSVLHTNPRIFIHSSTSPYNNK